MRVLRIMMPVALGLLIAGCGLEEVPVAGSAPVEGIELAGEYLGEYRVATVNGGDIDLPNGVAAIISADRIEVSSGCINMAWNYTYDGQALKTEAVPAVSCRRALHPEEQAVEAAFGAAEKVVRTPANGLEFAGSAGSVILFSQ